MMRFISTRAWFGAAVLAASILGIAGAHATPIDQVYNLTLDNCTGGCGASAYGTITITGDTTTESTLGLTVDVKIASGELHSSNGLHTLVFDPVGTGLKIAIGSSTPNFKSLGAGTYHEDGFGNFTWAIQSTASNSHGGLAGTELKFVITDTSGLITFGSTTSNSGPTGTSTCSPCTAIAVPFAVDLTDTSTGAVGATLAVVDSAPAVPETSTWTMLILGFCGVGGLLSRRRAGSGFATA